MMNVANVANAQYEREVERLPMLALRSCCCIARCAEAMIAVDGWMVVGMIRYDRR